MWITLLWYNFRRLYGRNLIPCKSILMRKTILINLLLILAYYLFLQFLAGLPL